MPKIAIEGIPQIIGTKYPPTFQKPCADRIRQRLSESAGIVDFGVNLTQLPPGNWSSQRHWHSEEDEFIFILAGEVVLVEDGSEVILHAGEAAAFPKNSKNGHHLINKSERTAVYLEVGSRSPTDVITCSDVDMMSPSTVGKFLHKDGRTYE